MSSKVSQEIAALRRIAAFHGEEEPPRHKESVYRGIGDRLRYLFYYTKQDISYIAENYRLATLEAGPFNVFCMLKKDFIDLGLSDCLKVVKENKELPHHFKHTWKTYAWKCEGHDIWNIVQGIENIKEPYNSAIKGNGNWYGDI